MSKPRFNFNDLVRMPNGGGVGRVVATYANPDGFWHVVEFDSSAGIDYGLSYRPCYEENLAPHVERKTGVGDKVSKRGLDLIDDGSVVVDSEGFFAHVNVDINRERFWVFFEDSEQYSTDEVSEWFSYPLTVIQVKDEHGE